MIPLPKSAFEISEFNHKYANTWIRFRLFDRSAQIYHGRLRALDGEALWVDLFREDRMFDKPFSKTPLLVEETNFTRGVVAACSTLCPRPKYVQVNDRCLFLGRSGNRTYRKGFQLTSPEDGYNTFIVNDPLSCNIVRKGFNLTDHYPTVNHPSELTPDTPPINPSQEGLVFVNSWGYNYKSLSEAVKMMAANKAVSVALDRNVCVGLSCTTEFPYTLFFGLVPIADFDHYSNMIKIRPAHANLREIISMIMAKQTTLTVFYLR